MTVSVCVCMCVHMHFNFMTCACVSAYMPGTLSVFIPTLKYIFKLCLKLLFGCDQYVKARMSTLKEIALTKKLSEVDFLSDLQFSYRWVFFVKLYSGMHDHKKKRLVCILG